MQWQWAGETTPANASNRWPAFDNCSFGAPSLARRVFA
jgi:hypothetical protein